MPWTPLPTGGFTGIDWAQPNATTGFDPYLVWAEADNFAGYDLKSPLVWLPLVIELKAGVSVQQLINAASSTWLQVPPVYTSAAAPAGLRFCTAKVKQAFFTQTAPGGALAPLVLRFELCLPRGEQTPPLALPGATVGTVGTGGGGALLDGKVIGLIDGGLAFAQANFVGQGSSPGTRIAHFWRQDAQGVGTVPANMGYGHAITAQEIDQAMLDNTYHGLVDESRVYAQFGMGMALNKALSHGTHILDLAAGPRTLQAQIAGVPPDLDAPPSWAMATDDASRCPVVAVQLDWPTVRDTSGGSMAGHILDGLLYILSHCQPSAQVAVNLSWGTLAGPHDGTALLEAAMDQLIDLKAGHLQIIIPVCNSYQGRTHANCTLQKEEQTTLNWQGLPGDSTQNFLEIWLPEGAQGIEIRITPPGQPSLPALKWGESRMWLGGANGAMAPNAQPLCALIYPKRVALGQHGTCALIAVAPTFAFKPSTSTAPSGRWQVTLSNTKDGAVTVDAYIERDDVVLGHHTGAQQSHFEDVLYDTSGNPDSFVDHPSNPTLIRRSGTFNSIASGAKTLSVGGVRLSDGSWAHYSPRKPDPDATRPTRPGVVKVPDTEAYSDENAVLVGVKAAGTRSGGVVRLVGTSDAAPQVTRRVLNAM